MVSVFRRNAGFSLIELSIMVMIASLVTVTAMEQYNIWLRNKIFQDNSERAKAVGDALTLYVMTYGRLPCPADPSIAPDAPSAGYEACPPNFGNAANQPTLSLAQTNNAATDCNGKVCRVSGQRDAYKCDNATNPDCRSGNSADDADSDSFVDPVLIGSVPFASLGLPITEAVDGWGNKLTYAVTEYLTNADPTKGPKFLDQWGAIKIQATAYNKLTGITSAPSNKENKDWSHDPGHLTYSFGTYMLAVISHGPDGKGAYSYLGRTGVPCGAPSGGYDWENCNGDSVFLDADPATGVYNPVPGATHFDDAFVVYRIRTDSDKWFVTNVSSIQNKAGGKVGVGNNLPSYTLDVGGNIKMSDYRANQFCSDTVDPGTGLPDYCFQSSMIAGDVGVASTCATSYVDPGTGTISTVPRVTQGVDGAQSNHLSCLNMINMATNSCPPGQYIKGIDASGGIICATP